MAGLGVLSVLFLLAVHVKCRPYSNVADDSERELLVIEERLLDLISKREQHLPTPSTPTHSPSTPTPADENEYGNTELEHEKKEIEQIENFLKTNNLVVPKSAVDANIHKRLDDLVAVLRKDQDTVFIENGKVRKVAPSTLGDYLQSLETGPGSDDDMVLSPEQKAAMNSAVDKRRVLIGGAWTTNIIPYEFDDNALPSATTRTLIREAMAAWESLVCISFRPRYANDKTWITIGTYSGCYSMVGEWRSSYGPPTGQTLSIGFGCEHLGIIKHELGHAMGFFHEQSRQDRDQHVTVHFENILPGLEYNFRKTVTEIYAAYDVSSLMHYGRTAFTNNSKPTISTTHPDENVLIGNRDDITFYDIKVASSLYQCAAACYNLATPPPVCQNTGFLDKHSCTRCKCPEGLGGSTCSEIDPSWTVAGTCGKVFDLQLNMDIIIQTPNFLTTGAYGAGNKCAWLIKTSLKGYVINLKILSLDTNTANTDDYVEVRKNLPGQTGIFFRGDTSVVADPSTPLYTVSTKVNGSAQMTVLFSSSPDVTQPGRGFMGVASLEKITACLGVSCTGMSDCVLDSSLSTGFKCVCQHEVSGQNCDVVGNLTLRETFDGAAPFLFSVDDWLLNSGTTPSSTTGPNGDFSGIGGSYIYYETSLPRLPYEAAMTYSTVFFDGSVQRCLFFAYHMYGVYMGTLHVNLQINGAMTRPLFNVTGDHGNRWHLANVTIPRMPHTIYKIVFEGIRGIGFQSDIAIDAVNVTVCNPTTTWPTSPCASAPCAGTAVCVVDNTLSNGYKCLCRAGMTGQNCDVVGNLAVSETFESAPFLFTDDDWLLNSGTTASIGTGPNDDFSGKNGSYLYYETSAPRAFNEAAVTKSTMLFVGSVQRCLVFAYHMFGYSMGTLNVEIEINGTMTRKLFSETGNQGNLWHVANVTIPAINDDGTRYKIVFEGIKGRDYQSDIAIDAINVTASKCLHDTKTPATACIFSRCQGYSVCIPDESSDQGYQCICRQGVNGQNCDLVVKNCSATECAFVCRAGNVTVSETFEGHSPFLFTDDDWQLNSGRTPSSGTGPDGDYPNGRGSYLYYETSAPRMVGESAMTYSTVSFEGSVQRCLTFAYHMFGGSMGTLYVKLEMGGYYMSGPLLNVTGDHGNVWHVANVTIPAMYGIPYKIVFEGILGTDFQSDIAIDAINVTICNGTVGPDPSRSTPSPVTTTRPRTTRRSQTTETIARRPPTTEPTASKGRNQPVSVYTDELYCDFEEDLSDCLLSNSRQDMADFVRSDECMDSGPCGDHTTGFGVGYYLIFRPWSLLPNDIATLVGPWLLFNTYQVCIGGFFYLSGDARAQFKVESLRHQGSKISGSIIDSTNTDEWLGRETTVDIAGAFRLLIIAEVNTQKSSVSIDDIYIHPGGCDGTYLTTPTMPTTPPPRCPGPEFLFDDFETDASVFHGEPPYFQWTRNSGSTPSVDTGPDADTSGSGHYMYTEVTNPRVQGDMFKMKSDRIQTYTPEVCLEFMLYDYGSSMGVLNVTVEAADSDQVYGSYFLPEHSSQHQAWQKVQINARTDYADAKVSFVVTRTDGWQGDYAVDDVGVYCGPCVLPI